MDEELERERREKAIHDRIDTLVRCKADVDSIIKWYVEDREFVTAFNSAFLTACAVVSTFIEHILRMPRDDKDSHH